MFVRFSPVRKETQKTVKKYDESEKTEVLSLAPFTHNPKLFFEDVNIGVTVTRKLLISNPTSLDVHIFVSHDIPQELNVILNWSENIVPRDKDVLLEVTWCPLKEISARYVISVTGEKIHRGVPVAFKSLAVKKKTGAKPKPKHISTSKRSPPQRKSPTKTYYSSKRPSVSPKKYSPSNKKSSPLRKFSPSPTKIPSITVGTYSSPKHRGADGLYRESPKSRIIHKNNRDLLLSVKENIPMSLNISDDSNVFVSPASATFHLDYLQPIQRRETYVVNGTDNSPEMSFDDSLENISPNVSSRSPNIRQNNSPAAKLPLGLSTRDNIPLTPTNDGFAYKLVHLESFCFTPVSTPVKQIEELNATLSAVIEQRLSEKSNVTQPLLEENRTFDIVPRSPNISSETYVKSNLSTETYVKGNASFETYVKGNLSSATYTKDSSVGDIANLSLSPVSPKILHSPTQPSVDGARQVIEANLWTGVRRPLTSIKEESYLQQSLNESNVTEKSFLKRKSCFDISVTPVKKPNLTSAPTEWSKKGGTAFRIAKKTTGLNVKKSPANKTSAQTNEAIAVVTKTDTNAIIIQNPFLLAATNLVDPFMTPHLQISEEWLDQQQTDFKKWLNALLTPPEELNFEEQVIDVAKVWQECKKREVEVAPTKEEVSNKYHTSNKLNSLRKSAQVLFRSKELAGALSKVVQAVETGKLVIREDKDIHLNLLLRSEIMSMLLSYNPLWLRIGLETIYNEIIPLKSNSDMLGLSTFMATRLMKDPYLMKRHKSVHSPKYISDFKKFFLKKFFILVYFLDQAKNKKLIPHDPCLFSRNAVVKESKELLTRLAREMLAAVGDINKYLKHIGYVVTHSQSYIHEFDYAVKNLGVDLRDGVRLTRVMELILLKDDLTSNLRVPAISRLQKIHNMKIVFDSLEKAGYKILYDISPKDIVDGHKEKTLSFLWQIIYKFQAPLMVKSATTIQTWFKSLPVTLKMRKLQRERLRRENAAKKIQIWYRRKKLSKKLFEFISLLHIYLENVKREKAATKIQSYYKMYHLRNTYNILYKTVLNIQRYAKGWLVRNVQRERIKKAVIIQKNVRMLLTRKRYLKTKKAANIIQARYRALRKMKKDRSAYIELKGATIFIQRRFRAKRLAIRDRNSYEKLKWATVFVQRRYTANRLCRIECSNYTVMRKSVIRIQSWYRSILAMKHRRQEFLILKKSVIVIEEWYVALKSMRTEKKKYESCRNACKVIQQHYRAYKQMNMKRKAYLELRASTIFMQQRYRAKKEMERQKRSYEALKSSTVFVQRKFRANKAMTLARRSYMAMKNAAVKIQRWFKATLQMRECRITYVSLKHAVLIFEERYEAKKLMKNERSNYQRLHSATITIQRRYRALVAMRKCQSEYKTLRASTVFIQRKFRANKLAVVQRQLYVKLREATITLQRRYRMTKARKEFLKLRKSCVTVQRKWRAKKVGEHQFKEYITLKATTLWVQRKWRANRLTKLERENYRSLRRATGVIQSRWRAKKSAAKERKSYLAVKSAVVGIQQRWRAKKVGVQQFKEYATLKATTLWIQRKWRANRLAKLERENFESLKRATGVIQSRWRAKMSAAKERKSYLALKNAVVGTQQRWRAKKVGKQQLKEYKTLKATTLFIQRKWRANQLAKLERENYQSLRRATGVIQSRWRAKKSAEKERKSYLVLKSAVVATQQRWRAKKAGERQFKEYTQQRLTALWIQRKWRANRLARLERENYQSLKSATVTIQSRWRAKKLAIEERNSYLALQSAVTGIQQRWRAKKLAEQQLKIYKDLKRATIFIQRRWRANKACRTDRDMYNKLKNAVCVVQREWRAKRERNYFVQLKNAAIVIQRRWRAQKVKQSCLQSYKALKEATVLVQKSWRLKKLTQCDRSRYMELRKAAICIQRRWTSRKLTRLAVQRYESLKIAVCNIQRRFRAKVLMKRQRERYVVMRTAAIRIQQFYRGYVLMKKQRMEFEVKRKTVVVLQTYVRGYLVRRKYAYYFTAEAREERRLMMAQKKAATKIQALWRGYSTRSIGTPQSMEILQRAKKANALAEPHNTLGSKCKVGLQALVNEKTTVFVINKALEDLDFITRHSRDMCVYVAPFLPQQMYVMIKTTNRSLPEMSVCLFSVNILINIYKYKPTRKYSFVPEYIDNIITVMLRWCDKDAQLFPTLCTLLWLFAHNPTWKRQIKAVPNIDQKFSKVQAQVARKDSMVKRAGVKGHSVFMPFKTLPLPSCESDWGLEYKHKPYVFTNSVHAFSSLLSILDM